MWITSAPHRDQQRLARPLDLQVASRLGRLGLARAPAVALVQTGDRVDPFGRPNLDGVRCLRRHCPKPSLTRTQAQLNAREEIAKPDRGRQPHRAHRRLRTLRLNAEARREPAIGPAESRAYAARVVFGGSERRDMRLELHQHQPPTARTGTTYSIEMYQCIRHASALIPAKAITPSPRFLRRRLGPAGAAAAAPRAAGISIPGMPATRVPRRHARGAGARTARTAGRAGRSPRRARSPPSAHASSPASRTAARSTAPFCAPTWIGTCQSKISVRLLLSLTCGGVSGDIQWMRWSCHSNCPVRSTTTQCGGALGARRGGNARRCRRSSVQVVRGRARVLLGRAIRQHARVRFALIAVDRDRLARVIRQQQPVGELEHFQAEPGHVRRDAVMFER